MLAIAAVFFLEKMSAGLLCVCMRFTRESGEVGNAWRAR
jgi:hypothetical protein